jgi:hypothetical protein
LGYKLGQLKILELRKKAQTELGSKFDIKAFHDEVLNAAALPLSVLDARVTAWISEQNKGAASSLRQPAPVAATHPELDPGSL